ncbi:MAG: hypothetical protein ABW065_14465 [Solirubrobacterales bacterium]
MDELPVSSAEARKRLGRENRQWLEIAKDSLVQEVHETHAQEEGERRRFTVTRKGVGPISITVKQPEAEDDATGDGDEEPEILEFLLYDLEVDDNWGKYLVVVHAPLIRQWRPQFDAAKPVKLRIDSGCVSGQIFHDNTCECRDQMHAALERIAEHGQGLLISIPEQDGRGRGMPFKLATLLLQKELDLDTVRVSALLDPIGERDERTYGGAIAVLRALGVEPGADLIHLSNNEEKHAVLRENGFNVTAEDLNAGHTPQNRRHLEAKQKLLGHQTLAPEVGADSEGAEAQMARKPEEPHELDRDP